PKKQEEKDPPIAHEPTGFPTPAHKEVYKAIKESEEPAAFDMILQKTDADITELYEILLDLEIDGFISAMPGNRYIAAEN
ncbi:MAG: hypothetical protein ACI4J4_05350, partial [Ruminiclostridium sp.]